MSFESDESVSYTHLDVYKRQHLCYTICRVQLKVSHAPATNDALAVHTSFSKLVILRGLTINITNSLLVSAEGSTILAALQDFVALVFPCLTAVFVLTRGGFVPVSYTHLDVYKRQQLDNVTCQRILLMTLININVL